MAWGTVGVSQRGLVAAFRVAGKVRRTASPRAVEETIRGLVGAARQLVLDAPAIALAAESAARARLRSSQEAARAAGRTHAETAAQNLLKGLGPGLAEQARILAPGAAGLAPDDPAWARGDVAAGPGWAGFVRIGTDPETRVPAVVPLLGTAGWCVVPEPVDGDARAGDDPTTEPALLQLEQDRHTALRLVQQTAIRLVAAADAFGVRMDCLDPAVSGILGALGGVTGRYPQVVGRAVHESRDGGDLLTALVEASAARGHRMAQSGVTSFEELQAQSRNVDPHRVVVVLDYPRGIDQAAQANLVRLASTGAQRGISLLLTYDMRVQPASGVDPNELLSYLTGVVVADDGLAVDTLFDMPVAPDRPIRDVAAGMQNVVARIESAQLPTIGFDEILPPPSDWWRPVTDGIETAVGFADQDLAMVRLRSSNPPLPHLLAAGAVGQGKSNLLLTLIHGLAVRYSPADLQMYLLDFKHGVEFARLGPAPGREVFLPHAKVLGIHADRMFGVAVLRDLTEELARRAAVFKAADVVDIADFPPGPERPPRILAVLDEFQVLMDGDDGLADEAVALLERLARLGRAYGVHLVLSTQTLDGTTNLSLKRDAIFGQVPLRVALKTTASDSQVVLGQGNTAAAGLQFRGQAILNTNSGMAGDNQQIQVAHADHDRLRKLRQDLWRRAGGREARPPRVFHLAEPAHLPTSLSVRRPQADAAGGALAWAGLPVAVTEEPTVIPARDEPGSGVIVVGDGPAEALGVLSGLTLSTVLARPAGSRPTVLVLDATPADLSTAENKRALVEVARAAGCEVEHLTSHEVITQRIIELSEQIGDRSVPGPVLLVGIGLHALRGMKDCREGSFTTPADALAEVLGQGPAAGVVSFGWWNRVHVVTDQLGYQRADVAAYVFLRHPSDGVRDATGLALVKWDSPPARVLVWDGIGVDVVHAVPFAPLTRADADLLVAQLRGQGEEP